MAKLAQSPDLRRQLGVAARALAVERFSSDAIGRAIADLYGSLAAGARA
jgi:glycosyltransferase involved in cell wall biosynthesis